MDNLNMLNNPNPQVNNNHGGADKILDTLTPR